MVGVINNDDLSYEVLGILVEVVLEVRSGETSAEILDGEGTKLETNDVTGLRIVEGLAVGCGVHWCNVKDHAELEEPLSTRPTGTVAIQQIL